jgi:hypothetical protein
LEDEVAVRDQQLETYREELTSTKSENSELRKEIERLRQEIMEGRSGGSIFDVPPAESKSVILAQTNGKATRASKNVAARPNRNKDLPSSGSTRGFWGGSTIGGTTPVHTTLIPDFDISALSGKPRLLQENLNPLLNSAPASREDATPHLPLFSSGLDGLHNFTLKGLDTDRMQLWSRMAREAGAAQAAREKLSASPASSYHSSLGSSGYSPQSALSQFSVSPLFLLSPTNAGIQASQKEGTLSSPTLSQAVLATSISNTISGKLMGSLWRAFAPKQTLDLDKVKRVLEGKAELHVVDVENSNLTALEESIKAMNLGRTTPKPASKKSSVDALEEGLKGMSLAGAARMDAGLVANRKECGAMAAATAASTIGLFQRPMRAGHSPIPAHQPTSKHTVAAQH